MKAYQADIAKFQAAGAQVYGISTDDLETNGRFAKELELSFPLLSDTEKKVAKLYGILNEKAGFAMRFTFVVDKKGVIQHIEESAAAIAHEGALNACNVLSNKKKA
jgi:peroxiredoxin Q/BCP